MFAAAGSAHWAVRVQGDPDHRHLHCGNKLAQVALLRSFFNSSWTPQFGTRLFSTSVMYATSAWISGGILLLTLLARTSDADSSHPKVFDYSNHVPINLECCTDVPRSPDSSRLSIRVT